MLDRRGHVGVISYMKTLEMVLGANLGVAPDTNISADLYNPTKRQMHMRRLVEEGRTKISRTSKITNGVGDPNPILAFTKVNRVFCTYK